MKAGALFIVKGKTSKSGRDLKKRFCIGDFKRGRLRFRTEHELGVGNGTQIIKNYFMIYL